MERNAALPKRKIRDENLSVRVVSLTFQRVGGPAEIRAGLSLTAADQPHTRLDGEPAATVRTWGNSIQPGTAELSAFWVVEDRAIRGRAKRL